MSESKTIDIKEITKEQTEKMKNGERTEAKTEDNKYSDNQFFGAWFSYKTNHVIIINGSPLGNVPYMFERVQMTKPFEIAPVPQVLKK